VVTLWVGVEVEVEVGTTAVVNDNHHRHHQHRLHHPETVQTVPLPPLGLVVEVVEVVEVHPATTAPVTSLLLPSHPHRT
jgi:hypothetical protein